MNAIKISKTKPMSIAVAAVLLLVVTGALRLVDFESLLVSSIRFLLVFTIYIGMLAAWTLSVWRRMLHGHIRGYLLATASLMLLWIFLRTLKHGPFDDIDAAARWLWYGYYIPMILIPLLSFFAALCLGKPEDWRPGRKYSLLFIPAAALILGVLTNDYHRLAFSFGPDGWDTGYTYRVLYYLVALWMAGFLLLTLRLLFKKSHIPHTKKRIWLPLAVIGIGAVYTVLYAIDSSKTGFGFIEMTAMLCAIMAGIWESCIITGLLPSNTKYGAFFDASPLSAQVVGADGRVFYSARLAQPVPPALFARLKEAGSLQPDPDTALHASPIRGGYVVWQEDVSQFSRLIEQLRDTGTQLQDGVELLKDELDTRSRRLHIEEQNRLYDLTLRQTMPQLEKIKRNLEAAPHEREQEKLRLLREINILGTYIKRRGNLVLMAEGCEAVTAEELARCFYESFGSLEACGVRCVLSMQTVGAMDPAHAVLFYDLFEAALEASLFSLRNLLVTLSDKNDALKLSVQIESDAGFSAFPCARWRKEQVAALGGRVFCEAEAPGVFHIALRLQKEGAL